MTTRDLDPGTVLHLMRPGLDEDSTALCSIKAGY